MVASNKELLKRRKERNRYNLLKKSKNMLRLSVHRSNFNIYAQIIDDVKGKTLVAASTLEKDLRKSIKYGGNIKAAKEVGELVAKRAIEAGVKKVVFDRGGFLFHGRVRALAEAAREKGLKF